MSLLISLPVSENLSSFDACRLSQIFCVSGIHRERNRKRNHGSTRSTRPITVHERTAICKSHLEPIIENPGNTWGTEQAFGR